MNGTTYIVGVVWVGAWFHECDLFLGAWLVGASSQCR